VAPSALAAASAGTMAPMPTAARYAPTPATYNASRKPYWHTHYPAAPPAYAAVAGLAAVATSASSLEGFGLEGSGLLGGSGLGKSGIEGFGFDGTG
jgi:hypothetical protein